MKNFEHVIDDILKYIGDNIVITNKGEIKECNADLCDECIFDSEENPCYRRKDIEKQLKKWLLSEPTKLTVLQHEILKRAYDNGFRWIAKDVNKEVYVYTVEPERKAKYFIIDDLDEECKHIPLWLETFDDIVTWEGGAVEIIDLLNNCEVID